MLPLARTTDGLSSDNEDSHVLFLCVCVCPAEVSAPPPPVHAGPVMRKTVMAYAASQGSVLSLECMQAGNGGASAGE